jgi:hypothetical protein
MSLSRLVLALLVSVSATAVQAYPNAKAAADTQVKPFDGLQYRLVGPFRGGRATGVTGVAGDPSTF